MTSWRLKESLRSLLQRLGTPIVVVLNQAGSYWVCGDYKVTVNQALEVDQYPLLRPVDLLATLAGGQKFTKLHL